ncbi:MAG: alpha-amylase [Ferruginibacter sp.]|uniref:alpha-amylase family protein n=1 Tax=Ferruginibacter sp. TaxID=1940288 RepID=UPI002659A4E3|nr:alpha-amylase family protein [Ferruginibacter sp.]MDB5276752.1 alpha-amylase [Ferruginibacter sp.]
MYDYLLHQKIKSALLKFRVGKEEDDLSFYSRLIANASTIKSLYDELYRQHPAAVPQFDLLIETLTSAHKKRKPALKKTDAIKAEKGNWFLSNEITGMSLYVDQFCGNLTNLGEKLDYFDTLGVNFLHLMPLFESPAGESDGGYAVSDFRKINPRFGTLDDLIVVQQKMSAAGMYLMTDIVLNHTSRLQEWAMKAKDGDKHYQDYFYMYDDRTMPDIFEQTMPDIFPETAAGNFTYVPECHKWVMTVFHNYQWDLNFSNPAVLAEMLDIVLFYANLGVDVLRIDAPAFIWKEPGTTCQNLPKAHTLLRLLKQCVQVASPGMALLGEAIVAPKEIMQYFGTGNFVARECDFAYNATQMALQWDALATGDTRVMLAAQHELLKKPYGTSWLTYTRCHDDIGLGYDDYMIQQAGFNPYLHRKFLKDFYSGNTPGSTATGALFSVNPKTQDARISGTLASLCGLEKAIANNNENEISTAINRIIVMQAASFFIGGLPMLFYGDEVGYTNDYSYLSNPAKSYDNRWMHRPVIDWDKNSKAEVEGTIEHRIFSATQQMIRLRKKLPVLADYSNLTWLSPYNIHVAGFSRQVEDNRLFCFFNFKNEVMYIDWQVVKEKGNPPVMLYDHWNKKDYIVGRDKEYLIVEPYSFCLLEAVK